MTGRRDRCDLSGHPPAPLSSGWGPPACLVHLGARGCGRLSRTCTLEYSGGVAGGGGCDERHASGVRLRDAQAEQCCLVADGSARRGAPWAGFLDESGSAQCRRRVLVVALWAIWGCVVAAPSSPWLGARRRLFGDLTCCRSATSFAPQGKPRPGCAQRLPLVLSYMS